MQAVNIEGAAGGWQGGASLSDGGRDRYSVTEEALDLDTTEQRRTLWVVLVLNVLLAAAFFATGLAADSNALIANGLDNASDSLVYIVSLFAIGRPPNWKRNAARLSGVLLLVFAVGVLGDAAHRYLTGSDPLGPTMMVMAVIAGSVNGVSLWLLRRLRGKDVNLRAADTFSVNDFVSNAGILVGGGLVLWTGESWPDLVVGVAVALIALKGGIEILRDARKDAETA